MSILPLMIMPAIISNVSNSQNSRVGSISKKRYYIIFGMTSNEKKQYWSGQWWINEREKARVYNSFEEVLNDIKKFSNEKSKWDFKSINWEVY